MKYKTIVDVKRFLNEYIPSIDDRHNGLQKFERVKHFMHLLGNPQNKLKVIHIAGTSGKGSTSQIIAKILTKHGFKTGLTVSPHIVDLRERTQINCENISEDKYIQYLDEMIPSILKISNSTFGKPTFFEIAIAHAYYSFWKEKVDYAIIETGMGGRYDASNTASNSDKLCVLTKIGFDHQEFLGNSIFQIALEKAEIIHEGNFTLSSIQSKEAEKAIDTVAKIKKTKVQYILVPKNVTMTKSNTEFNFSFKNIQIENLKISLLGAYQTENVTLAIAAVYELGERDRFYVDEKVVRDAVRMIDIPGRFQISTCYGKTIVIDGAHNTQKMDAFISSLKKIFPDTQFDFLLAFKKGKDVNSMLKIITPIAKRIYITEFAIYDQGLKLKPITTQVCIDMLKSQGYDYYIAEKNAENSLHLAMSSPNNILVITGSMYLVSELYDKIHS